MKELSLHYVQYVTVCGYKKVSELVYNYRQFSQHTLCLTDNALRTVIELLFLWVTQLTRLVRMTVLYK